jgi:hypothetical protein
MVLSFIMFPFSFSFFLKLIKEAGEKWVTICNMSKTYKVDKKSIL